MYQDKKERAKAARKPAFQTPKNRSAKNADLFFLRNKKLLLFAIKKEPFLGRLLATNILFSV